LDAIHDPGNLGTIFRTAAAAGADLLLLSPQCADPYAPKVIRSGMGAHLKLPFRQLQWQEISAFFLQFPEIRILASDMEGGLPHWRHDLTQPLALIIGSEAEGICQQAEQLASEKIFIPMAERVESLNAAVAAGILMFETVRQREVKK
jgi:TrmH family RNA methyltransferase